MWAHNFGIRYVDGYLLSFVWIGLVLVNIV
jgi:hypothetical protein